jgi:hypothetical protein
VLDTSKNTLQVTGCLNPGEFNAQPFGTIYISSVKMPDYVMKTGPININVYKDSFLDNLIVANPLGASLNP